MEEVGRFVVQEYVPIVLALGVLYPTFDNTNNTGGLGYGAGVGNFLAWGAFPNPADDTLALPGGVWTGGAGRRNRLCRHRQGRRSRELRRWRQQRPDEPQEDITNSRYARQPR